MITEINWLIDPPLIQGNQDTVSVLKKKSFIWKNSLEHGSSLHENRIINGSDLWGTHINILLSNAFPQNINGSPMWL